MHIKDRIYADFNGRNMRELALKYGMSVREIYVHLAKARAAHILRRKGGLE